MPVAAGLGLALILVIIGRVTGFDRERSYFSMLTLVIASYYPLFALMGGQDPMLEFICAVLFMGLALAPTLSGQGQAFVGLVLIAHGLFDLWLPGHWGHSSGPLWWAPFCAAVDLPLGLWVLWLYGRSHGPVLSHDLP
jgi:hypothetical protein